MFECYNRKVMELNFAFKLSLHKTFLHNLSLPIIFANIRTNNFDTISIFCKMDYLCQINIIQYQKALIPTFDHSFSNNFKPILFLHANKLK